MSLGGLTAIALSAEAPELVRKIVLVDVLPGSRRSGLSTSQTSSTGRSALPALEELLSGTARFNPGPVLSSLRRGILHNAEQQPDGTWVWRWARHRIPRPRPVPHQSPRAGQPSSRYRYGSSGKRCRRSPCRCCFAGACGRTRCWTTTTSGTAAPPASARSFTSRKPATACRATRP